MQSKWFELIKRAEKLLGGPPPFINLRSLLTSEAGFLAARARRLAASVDHPFFEVVRACLRGNSVSYPFLPPSSAITEPGGTVTTGQRASNGLIILLVGQCHVGVAASPTKLYSQHRSLAELFETIHLAITIHKSLIDPKSFNVSSLSASHHSGDLNDHNMVQDLEAGNKVATLTGDVLLASVSTTLASFHNARIVDIVSEAIGNMLEAEFSPLALHFTRSRLRKSSTSHTDCSGQTHTPQSQIGVPQWLEYVGLSRGSIMGSCCQSTVMLAEPFLSDQPKIGRNHGEVRPADSTANCAYRLGHGWATLIRLLNERDYVRRLLVR
ncbi:Decaprenyl-diphosphate synthase subunit 2 [Paragonimus kellicotti]|nr:Decaprenyl-diphosphate synthase subunit 2 [Paragonimus kellicotti]